MCLYHEDFLCTIFCKEPGYSSTLTGVTCPLHAHWMAKHVMKLVLNLEIYFWMNYNAKTPNGIDSGE